MKQILRKSTKIFALLGFVMLISNCQNEAELQTNQSVSIRDANTWFDTYKANTIIHPLFINLVYHWGQAEIEKLNDGAIAVKLPVTYLNQNPNYHGKCFLYLYPQEEKTNFKAILYEFFPDELNEKTIDFTKYNGFIFAWDLSYGFLRGAKFTDNNSTNGVLLKINTRSITAKSPDITNLEEVVIIGSGGSSNLSYNIGLLGIGSIPVVSSGGFVTYSGGGSSATASASTITVPAALVTPCEKLIAKQKEIALQLKNEELIKKTNLHYESGYIQNLDGSFIPLKNLDDHSLDLQSAMTKFTIGFTHCHIDDFETGEYNADGDPKIKQAIRMLSPGDVGGFLALLRNANANAIPLSDIFGTMVSSYGNYTLAFNGDVNQVLNCTFNMDVFTDLYKTAMIGNKEKGMLNFLKTFIGIDGILLAKTDSNGTVTIFTLDANGKLVKNPCNN